MFEDVFIDINTYNQTNKKEMVEARHLLRSLSKACMPTIGEAHVNTKCVYESKYYLIGYVYKHFNIHQSKALCSRVCGCGYVHTKE